jgi:hypothetical protein
MRRKPRSDDPGAMHHVMARWLANAGSRPHFYEERRRENVSPYGLTKQCHSAQIYAKIRRNVERNGG